MKISTEIDSAAKIVGEERAIEYIARAGFDAWDFSMFDMFGYDYAKNEIMTWGHPLSGKDYLKFAKRLRQVADDCGIKCNQSHAPFPVYGPEMYPYLKRAIECTAEVGGEICVIHPENDYPSERNAEMYLELLPFAKECGVKIATENMWNWSFDKDEAADAACSSPESFKAHIDAVNDDFLVACVDIGHAEMKGLGTTAPDMIRYLGDKVQALHIHDNDKWHDYHQIPFAGSIDFAAVVKALKDVNYQGYFTLEANTYLNSIGATPDTLLKGLEDMAASARRLCDMFDEI